MAISAVVLAGGQATRMSGQDKGLVPFKERKLVEWSLDVISLFVEQVIISCNRNIGDYMPLADSVVCDRLAGFLGPLAGVHAALLVNQSESLLVLPCDTPFIGSELISRLIEQSALKS